MCRQEQFVDICNLITGNLELQHTFRTHTWGPVSISADPVSETVGAIVAGLQGYGQVGQAPNNRDEDEEPPGDYQGGEECKRGFRIFTNLDFLLHGRVYHLGTKNRSHQYIRLDMNQIDQNTREQISHNTVRIHRQIQSNPSSIQQVVSQDGDFFALDNMGRTRAPGAFVSISEEGICDWDKKLGDSIPGEKKGKTGGYGDVKEWKDIVPVIWLKQLCREQLNNEQRKGFSNEKFDALRARLEGHGVTIFPPPGTYIHMTRGGEIDIDNGVEFSFMLRQERGHFSLGTMNRQELRELLGNRIIFVSHHYDRLARVCCSVLSFQDLSSDQIDVIVNEQFDGRSEDESLTPNWYLFGDNMRHELYGAANSLRDRGAGLLAHAVQQPEGFEVTYWQPDDPELISEAHIEEILTRIDDNLEEMPVQPGGFEFENYYENEIGRRELALEFFQEAFVNFYRQMRVHTDANGMGGNIGFDHLIEHMVMLWFGLRGSRSGGKGVDVFELDGAPSEVKSATGQQGDYMGVSDGDKPFKAGNNVTKIQSWRRLFFNRLVDVREPLDDDEERGNLHLVMWAPTQNSMAQLHQNTVSFFSDPIVKNRQGRASATTKNNIQWTINDISDNRAISSAKDERWIDFERIVEFREHGPDGSSPAAIPPLDHPNTVPTVGPCECKYCKKGTFRWRGTGADRKFIISNPQNKMVWLLSTISMIIAGIIVKSQLL